MFNKNKQEQREETKNMFSLPATSRASARLAHSSRQRGGTPGLHNKIPA